MNPAVEQLLSEVENPVVESAFVQALRLHKTLRAAAVPDRLVVPALLLATVAKEWSEHPILDNVLAAAKRVRAWLDTQNPVFESHLLLSTIFNGLPLASNPQATYIVNAYKELTGAFKGEDYEGRKVKKSPRASLKRLSKKAA